MERHTTEKKETDEVKHYKYLGESINGKGNQVSIIERRIEEAPGVSAEIMTPAQAEELQHKQNQVIIKLEKPRLESTLLYNSQT